MGIFLMDDPQSVMLCTGRDEDVSGRNSQTFAPRSLRKRARQVPDLRRGGDRLQVLFELPKQAVLPGTLSAIPELEPDQIAKNGTIIDGEVADLVSDRRLTTRPERLNPRRGVDQKTSALAHGSSLIRLNSSWVMNPSRVPNFSASF